MHIYSLPPSAAQARNALRFLFPLAAGQGFFGEPNPNDYKRPPDAPAAQSPGYSLGPIALPEGEIALGRSLYGTPYYSDLAFLAGSYTEIDRNGREVTIEYPELKFLEAVITASRQNNIVTTPIVGRKEGPVYEYIGAQSTQLSVVGYIFNPDNMAVYPDAKVAEAWEILSSPVSFRMRGRFLEALNITNCVVNSWRTVYGGEFKNIAIFEVDLQSDVPFEFEIQNQPTNTIS